MAYFSLILAESTLLKAVSYTHLLVVDYPNIESSIIKINGKEVQASRLKDNRIQLATQKGDVITFENFPGRVTRLSALRKDSVTAELDFNTCLLYTSRCV